MGRGRGAPVPVCLYGIIPRPFAEILESRYSVKVIMMVAADYAAVEPQTGKLNVIGVFNRIAAKEFPIAHPRMYIAIKFEGEITDGSRSHQLSVALASEDGVNLIAIEGELPMPASPPGIPPQCNLVIELNQLKFENPGDYRFYVRVNEGELDESSVLQLVQSEG